MTPRARRRRRAADPARPRRPTCGPAATRSTWPPPARRPSRWPPATTPTWSILDLGLPGIDGIEVVAGLRGWTNVPIIVLSARDAEARQGRRPRRRRRRLRHQAVRHGRAARPPAGRRCAATRPGRRGGRRRDRPTSRSTSPPSRCTGDGERGAPHPDRVAPGRGPRPQRRQARHASASCSRRCGARSTATETNYLRVHLAHIRRKLEPEPVAPAVLHHRARHGLPLRGGRRPGVKPSVDRVSPARPTRTPRRHRRGRAGGSSPAPLRTAAVARASQASMQSR